MEVMLAESVGTDAEQSFNEHIRPSFDYFHVEINDEIILNPTIILKTISLDSGKLVLYLVQYCSMVNCVEFNCRGN